MKKLFIALTILCSVFTMAAVANEVKVTPKVQAAFESTFNKASNVKWAKVKNLYQADFTIEDQKFSAYFNVDGDMVVVARFITTAQLPFGLKQSLKEKASEHEVAYLFELSDEEGVHYYATIQKGDKKEMLQSQGSKKWMPYKKVKI